MKKKWIIVLSVALIAILAISFTGALFFDKESSSQSMTAGTLDLTVNGANALATRTYTNMVPERSQPNDTFRVKNVGSVAGYLDIENIVVVSEENGINDPEMKAGDVTSAAGEGELAQVLNLRLMLDNNCNGWYEASDQILYQGPAAGINGASYDANKSMAPGAEVCVNVLVNWWSTPNDNQAQSDDMTVTMDFQLGQETSQ